MTLSSTPIRIFMLSLCIIGISACNHTHQTSETGDKAVTVEKPVAAVEPPEAGAVPHPTASTEPEVPEAKPWIEKIRNLLKTGRLDEARKELEAFRKHYPDYRLPEELKSL